MDSNIETTRTKARDFGAYLIWAYAGVPSSRKARGLKCGLTLLSIHLHPYFLYVDAQTRLSLGCLPML